jgi:hypothetical protein
MIRPAKKILQNEPHPKWRSVVDAIFLHTNEMASGRSRFVFDYRWSNAPASIELDHGSRSFRLSFNDGKLIQLPPWELLKEENLPVDALVGAFAYKSVLATWELMLERFAASVSAGEYRLFARFDSFLAAFEPIPRDHWRLYRITDWSTGSATGPDNRQAWNVHAFRQPLVKSPSGRKPLYNQDQVNGEVRRLFRKFGPYGADKEKGWKTRADLQERIAQFLENTAGQSPSKSTLQVLVKKAMLASEADNA